MAGCFDRLDFKGTLEQRRKAIVARVNNHCSVDILLADEEIQSTERCTAMLIIERIKFRIQSLSVDYQFPQNCCFRCGDKKVKAWRIAENGEEGVEEIGTTPVQHRAKKSKTDEAKASCACKHATIDAGGSFCGFCGGFVDVSMCCGVVVKTPFCTVCGNKKSKVVSATAEAIDLSTSSDDDYVNESVDY